MGLGFNPATGGSMTIKALASLALIFAGTGWMLFVPTAADAQSTQADEQAGTLQEVVVTAQRREEKAVDVPITIAALDAQQLATANVQNLSDIQQLTPSLRFDNQTGFYQPSIRGIGTAVTTSGGGSNVGIYIDGFYSPNPEAADLQLLNVTGIQVLKGPQGTLFGHNTTGGAILVTTAEPSQEAHAQAKVDYGSFNAQRYQGYASGGLIDGLAGDIEGIFSKGNGFLTNIFDNDDHVGAYENWTVRTGLKYQFGDRVSALLRYTHAREDDPTGELINSNTDTSINPTTGKPWGITTLAVPGTFTTNPNQVANAVPVYVRSNNDAVQLTVKADLIFADLTSYSQWRQEDTNQSENLSQVAFEPTGTPLFQLGLPIFDSTYSQELLLASKPGPALQWTTGLYFFSNRDQYTTFIDSYVESPHSSIPAFYPPTLPGTNRIPLGGSSTTTQTYAYYLDATYELIPNKLFLTAGARVSHDIVDNTYYNQTFTRTRVPIPSIDSNKVTPRAVIRYKPTDRSSVYASFSEGYKARIIDAGGSCQDPPAFQCNPIQPEDVYAYEVGYKFEMEGFSTELSAFDYQYKNLQVSEFLGAAQAFIVNAAESRIYGIEDEFHYNWDNHVQVNGGVSWTHARYTTFGAGANGQVLTIQGASFGAPLYASCAVPFSATPVAACAQGAYYVNQSNILHDATMQHVPEWTANFGPRYTTGMTNSGQYSFSGNAYFTSNFFFSPSGTQFAQPSYTTIALRAEWDDPSNRYMAAVYGDNVTNVRYRTQVQYNGFGIGASWNAPATWGVEVGVKF
jgi:iron complex outermembrane receptor protein